MPWSSVEIANKVMSLSTRGSVCAGESSRCRQVREGKAIVSCV